MGPGAIGAWPPACSFYAGVAWGVPDIGSYAGPFITAGLSFGAGAFGASVNYFHSLENSKQFGITTGLGFGSVGFSSSGSITDYSQPFGIDEGIDKVKPYLEWAWPFPQNIFLMRKANQNAENQHKS